MIRYSQPSIGKPLQRFGVYSIAQQCPYSGGNAVYIARNYIALMGDTVIYDDASICLQQGIFRQGTINELPIEVYLKPNPADEYVEIFISNNNGINCSIKILDVLGKLHLNKLIDCKQKVIRIDTKQLSAGVYSVAFISDAYILKANKLIIER
nr:T9SS type A sorting domain-containing protein [Bacteroidota bacterium]